MKTPIPEKIDTDYRIWKSIGAHTRYVVQGIAINKLIDVLTEQQKEIGDQEGQIEHLERRVYELLKRVSDIEDSKNKPDSSNEAMSEPYTAMRSTGEYCTCNKVIGKTKDENIYETCMCDKPIKQQEDIREKIKEIIVEACTEAINDKVISKGFYADKILSIVKGE